MNNIGKRSVALVALLLVAVLAFYVGTAVTSSSAQQAVSWPITTPQPANAAGAVLESEKTYSSLYNQIGPSVVSINVVATQSGNNNAFPSDQGQVIQGTGTGFVIDTNGDIVTNNHVVEGATRIEVNFFDGSIYRGNIVGVDPDSDLAVIKVDRPASDLHPVTLGDSDQAFVGEDVAAMGSPFGEAWTLTTGIVSALNRDISSLSTFRIGAVIQTDAAINPGNSGGPLVNMKGEVIGVNAQILSQSGTGSGVGFAIPSNLVKRVAQSLISSGKMSYSYLGISGGDMNLYTIEAMKLPNNARGVVVNEVTAGGPAAAAGLKSAGNPTTVDGVDVPTSADIITAVNGTPVTGMEALISYLGSQTKPGDTVTMTVVRNGTQQIDLPVTLSARPAGT